MKKILANKKRWHGKRNEKQLRELLYITQAIREIRQKIIVIILKIRRHRQKRVVPAHTFLYRQMVKPLSLSR